MANGASLVYNPNGFYREHGKEYTDHMDTTCVFSDCFWDFSPVSSSSSGGIRGRVPLVDAPGTPSPNVCYSPTSPCLATDDPSDYPNPGFGIKGGYFNGLGISDVNQAGYCPGVRVPPGRPPRGGKVCAYCGPWEAKWLGIPLPEGCPQRLYVDEGAGVLAEDNFLVCMWMCPPAFENRSRKAAYDTMVLSLLANPGSFLLMWIIMESAARVQQFAEDRECVLVGELTVMNGAEYRVKPRNAAFMTDDDNDDDKPPRSQPPKPPPQLQLRQSQLQFLPPDGSNTA